MTVAATAATAVTPVNTYSGQPPAVRAGSMRRASSFIGDVLIGLAIILCIPFVLLVLGAPLALGVRFLLWITGML